MVLFKEQNVIASARCYPLNQEHQYLPNCKFSKVIWKNKEISAAVLWMAWIERSGQHYNVS